VLSRASQVAQVLIRRIIHLATLASDTTAPAAIGQIRGPYHMTADWTVWCEGDHTPCSAGAMSSTGGKGS